MTFFWGGTPVDLRISQARGGIRVAAASLLHSHCNASSEPHHSSWQCQILNSLSEARDRTHILMDTSQTCFHWATMVTSHDLLKNFNYLPPKIFWICVCAYLCTTQTEEIWETVPKITWTGGKKRKKEKNVSQNIFETQRNLLEMKPIFKQQ